MSYMRLPRSVRNNNPGNIERGKDEWIGLMPYGEMSSDQRAEQRFCVFREPKYGFRALAIVLRNYGRRHGLKTVREIISRFAPKTENATDAYVARVCDGMGVAPDAAIDLEDPAILTALCRAIAVHESGGWFFRQEDLEHGIALALAGGGGKREPLIV